MQAPGAARDASSLASYALGLACGVRLRFGWAYRFRLMRGDILGPTESAACQGVGRSLQAYRAARVNRLLVHGCKSSALILMMVSVTVCKARHAELYLS